MTPDEQEALSLKYSNSTIILLPLLSGKVAIFDNSRQLLSIVAALEHWQVRLFSKIALENLRTSPPSSPQPQSSAEELGF